MNVEEFQIINSLGIGRSGTVFKALWHGKEVALKLCDIEHNPEYEKALSKIHQSGFLHNDIREDNILAQRGKGGFRPCFIDFAFSKRNSDNTLFSDEMSDLKQLLNS